MVYHLIRFRNEMSTFPGREHLGAIAWIVVYLDPETDVTDEWCIDYGEPSGAYGAKLYPADDPEIVWWRAMHARRAL